MQESSPNQITAEISARKGRVTALIDNLLTMKNSHTFGESQKALFDTIMTNLVSLEKEAACVKRPEVRPRVDKNIHLEKRKIRSFRRAGMNTNRVLLKI